MSINSARLRPGLRSRLAEEHLVLREVRLARVYVPHVGIRNEGMYIARWERRFSQQQKAFDLEHHRAADQAR